MTRQHFQLIADTLRKVEPQQGKERTQWIDTIEQFRHDLAQTNPGFNEDKFLEACGLEV